MATATVIPSNQKNDTFSGQSHHEPPLTDAQKRELDQRYAEYQRGEAKLRDWQEVHKEIRAKYHS